MMERRLGLMESRSISLDIGVSSSIIAPIDMNDGQELMFEIETASRSSGSGLLNSDSQILKITGYRMDNNDLPRK